MNYQAYLAHFPKIGSARFKKLKAYFFDLKNLHQADLDDLLKSGLEENIAAEFISWRQNNPIEKILERLEKEEIYTISLDDPTYPYLLSQITDPPHTLFVRGQLPQSQRPTLAVVGTRRFTTYGKLICEELVLPLATNGLVIISGLALGIDGIAHQATIEANGVTVAVLGSGVNQKSIFPAAHKLLAQKIIDSGGAIISEYPPDFAPTKYSFPARNRLIAGLSLGTLIIEAPAKSGALITARYALDYNREVMCVPHALTSPTGAGPNTLIQSGAKLITGYQNIMEALNLKISSPPPPLAITIDTSTPEGKILNHLNREPKNINELIIQTGLNSSQIGSTLTMLEIKGLVKNLGGMNYIKNIPE